MLPPGYYALAEQVTRPFGPDVLTFQAKGHSKPNGIPTSSKSVALMDKPPKVRVIQESEADLYAKKTNRIAIRHSRDESIVAIIEILSPGNISSQHAIDELPNRAFVEPTAVGSVLIDMPLLLDNDQYVPVPLEATYNAAWRGVPERWKVVLETATS